MGNAISSRKKSRNRRKIVKIAPLQRFLNLEGRKAIIKTWPRETGQERKLSSVMGGKSTGRRVFWEPRPLRNRPFLGYRVPLSFTDGEGGTTSGEEKSY